MFVPAPYGLEKTGCATRPRIMGHDFPQSGTLSSRSVEKGEDRDSDGEGGRYSKGYSHKPLAP
jgi:hypothetical protein